MSTHHGVDDLVLHAWGFFVAGGGNGCQLAIVRTHSRTFSLSTIPGKCRRSSTMAVEAHRSLDRPCGWPQRWRWHHRQPKLPEHDRANCTRQITIERAAHSSSGSFGGTQAVMGSL